MAAELDGIDPELLGLTKEEAKELLGGAGNGGKDADARGEERQPSQGRGESGQEQGQGEASPQQPGSSVQDVFMRTVFERAAEEAATRYGIDVNAAKAFIEEILAEDEELRRELDEAVRTVEMLQRLGKGEISTTMADLTAGKIISRLGEKIEQKLAAGGDDLRDIKKILILKSILSDNDPSKALAPVMASFSQLIAAMQQSNQELLKAILLAQGQKKEDDSTAKLIAVLTQIQQQNQQMMMQLMTTLMTSMTKQQHELAQRLAEVQQQAQQQMLKLILDLYKKEKLDEKEKEQLTTRIIESVSQSIREMQRILREMDEKRYRELREKERELKDIVEKLTHQTQQQLRELMEHTLEQRAKDREELWRRELEHQKQLMQLQMQYQQEIMKMMMEKMKLESEMKTRMRELEYEYMVKNTDQALVASVVKSAVEELKETAKDLRHTLREYLEMQARLQQLGILPQVSPQEKNAIIATLKQRVAQLHSAPQPQTQQPTQTPAEAQQAQQSSVSEVVIVSPGQQDQSTNSPNIMEKQQRLKELANIALAKG